MIDRPGMTDYICGFCGGAFRRYASDIAAADRAAIRKGRTPPSARYCSITCANLANPRLGRPTGYVKPALRATMHPTTLDIAWAAGIYEGEGNCSAQVLQVTQRDTWIMERLRALFGGSIQSRPNGDAPCYHWSITGARKRGFIMTIYKFLSPRRQQQALAAITGEQALADKKRAARIATELQQISQLH